MMATCIRTEPLILPKQPMEEEKSAGPTWKTYHELYNVGHLYEGAVAHYEATGKRNLLDVAIKNADLVASVFGPGKNMGVPGHQEIEIGLIKLYRVTKDNKYLDLAKFFIDQRGNKESHEFIWHLFSGPYTFCRNRIKAVGHFR